jgi:adenylate kinase
MAAKIKRFPLNLVLFGPPGVGKGVYCSLLEKDLSLRAFSTGDYMRTVLHTKEHPLFTRQEILDIESKVQAGELLEDSIVNQIVQPQLDEARKTGLIFDGYPRTLNQARYLQEHLKINIFFNLHLREDILIRKLLGRRVCP